MQFGPIPIDEAIGAILAHSTPTKDGMLKKGRTLTAADIARLRAHGIKAVIAARLSPGDVVEDAAAQRIAHAIGGPHTRVAEPFTGRANIFATANGLAVVDATAIAALNTVDERITLATVEPFAPVTPGQMLATVKIIPFAVPADRIEAAERAAHAGRISVARFEPHRAGLILTRTAGTKDATLERRQAAIGERLAGLGSSIGEISTIAHTSGDVAEAISAMARQGLSPILVFGSAAIVDRADVIPAGLVAAGGDIIRLGMPVDPGNLLLLGTVHGTPEIPVIGIPSCAASLKLNGFDWVLRRLLAGIAVSAADLGAMGVGGLLKEIDSRPQPRLGGVSQAEKARHAPSIAAVVLAAGRSTRMGAENKLLAEVGGKPIVRRVVETALASPARPVVVVVGHRGAEVRAALSGLDVTVVDNPDFASGLASSLRAGLAALPKASDGAAIMLGDMPEIAPDLIGRLVAAFDPVEGRGIIVPVAEGKRGNPVVWARRYFDEMAAISGDTGAKHLLGVHAEAVTEIAAGLQIHADIDTPDALAALRRRMGAG